MHEWHLPACVCYFEGLKPLPERFNRISSALQNKLVLMRWTRLSWRRCLRRTLKIFHDFMDLGSRQAADEALPGQTPPQGMLMIIRMSDVFRFIKEAVAIFSEDDQGRDLCSQVAMLVAEAIN